MSVKERIAKVKDKAAKLAVKAAAVATLLGGAGTAVSCSENNRDADENGNKIERVEGEKTSVVFRTAQSNHRHGSESNILLENGDVLRQRIYDRNTFGTNRDDGAFLEPGDTVTYENNEVKAVRYKGGNGKQVNFGKIGKLGKDITD